MEKGNIKIETAENDIVFKLLAFGETVDSENEEVMYICADKDNQVVAITVQKIEDIKKINKN